MTTSPSASNHVGIDRLRPFGTTIFGEMSALAAATGAVNLGQGFPDADGPPELMAAAAQAMANGQNQYTPARGVPELREAIAEHQSRRYGLTYDPDREVLVTAGATEGITAAILGLCEPGDHVVLFDPGYDSYPAAVAMAGGEPTAVPLRPPTWTFDPDELEAAITPRTRLIVVNSPHNPTGAVADLAALDAVAEVCVRHDLVAITDEVYEHLLFDGQHVPLATRDAMRDRTVTVSSAGKTFSVTGWKVGWVCASPPLLDAVARVKQYLTYVSGGPLQYGVVAGLRLPDDRLSAIAADLRTRRDLLCAGLRALGLTVTPPDGGYFVLTDIGPWGEVDGDAFCRALPGRLGVAAIPGASLFLEAERGRRLVRWTYAKRAEILTEALDRLAPLAP